MGFFFPVEAYEKHKIHPPRITARQLTISPPHATQQEAGLERYAIAGQETDWDAALPGGSKKVPASGLLSVKRKAGAGGEEDEGAGAGERTPGRKDASRIGRGARRRGATSRLITASRPSRTAAESRAAAAARRAKEAIDEVT